uniref:Putative movement protein n=1 Tax=Morogoro maize-associated virus TaxID=2497337 RepID=A0A3S9JLQ9_9RHAB|nr:putative movement protein [Morogoro maize-associated virus]
MEPHAEFSLGKGREAAKSPLVAPSKKIGLIATKVKFNEAYSLFGRKKHPDSGTHLQFTSMTIQWTPLCPITAGGQLNITVHHNSTQVPILNIWSPVSSRWKHEVHGNLGFLKVEDCPYSVEGRVIGFSGSEAGIISMTLHMDARLRTGDLSPCKLIPTIQENVGSPLFLYTSYTEEAIPDTNIHILKNYIEDTVEDISRLSGGKFRISEGQALAFLSTFKVKITDLLQDQHHHGFINENTKMLQNLIMVASTSEISKAYRSCLNNVLDKMVIYDRSYWKKVLTPIEEI